MTRFRAAGRLFAAVVSTLQAALAPWLDLAIRVWLAQAFLVLQVRAMMLGGTSSHLTAPLGAGRSRLVRTRRR